MCFIRLCGDKDLTHGTRANISMDFVMGFLLTSHRYNVILVIVDKLTKCAHFIPVRDTYDVTDVACVFVRKVIHLHGIPKKIISDRDSRFTSRFWTSLQSALRLS